MRNISFTLAALAILLTGSLTSVAHAASLERQFADQRADLVRFQTTYPQLQGQSNATVDSATAPESLN